MSTSPASAAIYVSKFGGTSVATPERIRRVVQLIGDEPVGGERADRRIVVVSALGGVTDHLLRMIDEALARTGRHRPLLHEVVERHMAAAEVLAPEPERGALMGTLETLWTEVGELLDGISLLRECTGRTRDAILSAGERASVRLVAAAFEAAGHPATALDATAFIRTDDAFGQAGVQFGETADRIRTHVLRVPKAQVAVVTGFIGATSEGVVTTLGRSGSDYTATLIAAALGAQHVVIWTDVDGVMSADPRIVPEAATLPQLSYREAAEMAYFGAKVLHPRTMRPLQEQGIPLRIKNTLRPEHPGTLISDQITRAEGYVKAITTVRGIAIVMVEGAGILGTPGIVARAFTALADHRINVLMISQASSEHNLCIAVLAAEADRAVEALAAVFERERARGDISRIYAQPGCAIVSAVGEQMRQRPGLAGRMFSTLGRSGVNVLAIAQGASETNISSIVRDEEVQQAVRSLHEAFALARTRAHVFLIGIGVVGRAFLRLLERQAPVLLHQMNLNIKLVGLANTQHMVWDIGGIEVERSIHRLKTDGHPTDLDVIMERLAQSRLDRLIVVDATASDEVAHYYPNLLDHRVGVITPNKRANTQGYGFYERLQRVARMRQVPYLYETTVGAGLPVIRTLRSLLDSGDEVVRIEGVFSGTLAYLFNAMAEGRAFSDVLHEAMDKGFTEPDPRDDLGGEDVARKLLILAREMGLTLERADLDVEPLVPSELMDVSLDAFLERASELDAAWRERFAEAEASQTRLQYIGRIKDGQARVGVQAVDLDDPFANLRGTDNMVVYTTARYHDNPLVVQGPGAGPNVTAAGILADLVQAAQLVS